MNDKWKENLIKIEPYVPGEQSKESGIIKLNANENPYPPSPKVLEAIKNFDVASLRLYPDATSYDLKKAIGEWYSVDTKNVFVGNGSDDVLALAFQAFFNGKDDVLFPDITYSFYPVWCSLFNISYRNPALDENFRIRISDYFAPNGGIIIPNPNAPTSLGEGQPFFEKLMNNNSDSVVIVDEAYGDFGEYSAVELTKKHENLLVAGTLSKSRSLAGLRVGFALGSECLISKLEAVKNSYNSYTIDSIAMAAGAAAMRDNEYFEENVKKVKATRAFVVAQLRQMNFDVFDSWANFLLISRKDIKACELFEYLKKQKVFVRYFNIPRIDNHLRVTIGTQHEMDEFLFCVKNFLNQ